MRLPPRRWISGVDQPLWTPDGKILHGECPFHSLQTVSPGESRKEGRPLGLPCIRSKNVCKWWPLGTPSMRVAGDSPPQGVGERSTVVGLGEPGALESCSVFPAPRLCDEWGSGKFLSWLIFLPPELRTPFRSHQRPRVILSHLSGLGLRSTLTGMGVCRWARWGLDLLVAPQAQAHLPWGGGGVGWGRGPGNVRLRESSRPLGVRHLAPWNAVLRGRSQSWAPRHLWCGMTVSCPLSCPPVPRFRKQDDVFL